MRYPRAPRVLRIGICGTEERRWMRGQCQTPLARSLQQAGSTLENAGHAIPSPDHCDNRQTPGAACAGMSWSADSTFENKGYQLMRYPPPNSQTIEQPTSALDRHNERGGCVQWSWHLCRSERRLGRRCWPQRLKRGGRAQAKLSANRDHSNCLRHKAKATRCRSSRGEAASAQQG